MKTRDGLKVSRILRALEQIAGVNIRPGRNHPYVAFKEGYAVLCPVAASTDARKMVVPWVKQISLYQNSESIYQALRNGGWN
jgi:hypothetical protein